MILPTTEREREKEKIQHKKRLNPTPSRVYTCVCELANELEKHREPFIHATTPHQMYALRCTLGKRSFERINNLTIKQFFTTKRYIERKNALTTMTMVMVNSANVNSQSDRTKKNEREKDITKNL